MITFTAQDNHRGRAVPITHSGAGVLAARGAFVAVATQVSGHLGLDRGLQQQPGTEHRDLLDRTRQVLAAGEHPRPDTKLSAHDTYSGARAYALSAITEAPANTESSDRRFISVAACRH